MVLIIDDGFATEARRPGPPPWWRVPGCGTSVLAAPIGAVDTIAGLREVADEVVCLGVLRDFVAVGQGYDDFRQTSDAQVCELLAAAHRDRPGPETASRLTSMIGIERVGDVTTIEMQRSERRNALNTELVDSLREAVEKAAADDVRAIVLTERAPCSVPAPTSPGTPSPPTSQRRRSR